MDELTRLSATGLARAIRTGELSSREVVAAHLCRIEAVNERLTVTEAATFTMALAIFEAMTRFRLGLGVEPRAGDDVVVVDPLTDPLY